MKHLLSFILILVLISCRETNHKHDHSADNKISVTEKKASEVAALNNETLDAVFDQYQRLSTALVNENISESKIAANAMQAGAELLENGSSLVSLTGRIVAAETIDEQRIIFSDLSNEMIRIARNTGMRSGVLYVEYCPMAMDDKGAYWLSADAKIKNPYFGDKMLSCGEVKETIGE